MALTEEQLKELALRVDAQLCSEGHVATSAAYAIAFAANLIAALPKPEPVGAVRVIAVERDNYREIETFAEFATGAKLEDGQLLYTEAPIAHPASAPSEQKPVDAWHMPGLGEVHSKDHLRMIYCSKSESNEADDLASDELAQLVCDLLNSKHAAPQPDYKAQRDALLEALNKARNALVQWHVPENRYSAIESIDTAIASVKGGV